MRTLLVTFLLFASRAFAQLTSSVQFGYTHDSNVFGNFAAVPDNYLALNLSLDDYVGWEYSSLDLSYYGGLSSYDSYPEQDSWNHSANLNYRVQLSRIGENADSDEIASADRAAFSLPADSVETSLSFGGVLNRTVPHSGDFASYANFNSSATASLRYTIGRAIIAHVRYVLNYTGYDQITSLSNLENIGGISVAAMPSRDIYVYIDGSLGHKNYYGVDTVSLAVRNLINMHSNARYKGKGKGGGQSSQSTKTYILDSPSATQATYGIGVNFSSGKWSGAGSFLIRRNLSGTARYINAVSRLASVQSEIYDDPYSYQGSELGLMIARDSLIAGINLTAGIKTSRKDYNRAAFDTTQTVVVARQRQDRVADVSLGISRIFASGGFPTGYTVSLSYDHLVNSSNDEFYNYTDGVLTLALSVNLF